MIDPYGQWKWDDLNEADRWQIFISAYTDVCDLITIAVRDEQNTATVADIDRKTAICNRLTRMPTVNLISWMARLTAELAVVLADHSEITPDVVLQMIRESADDTLHRGAQRLRAMGVDL